LSEVLVDLLVDLLVSVVAIVGMVGAGEVVVGLLVAGMVVAAPPAVATAEPWSMVSAPLRRSHSLVFSIVSVNSEISDCG
jgi:ABC-type thiamine transport system ATPase subunit